MKNQWDCLLSQNNALPKTFKLIWSLTLIRNMYWTWFIHRVTYYTNLFQRIIGHRVPPILKNYIFCLLSTFLTFFIFILGCSAKSGPSNRNRRRFKKSKSHHFDSKRRAPRRGFIRNDYLLWRWRGTHLWPLSTKWFGNVPSRFGDIATSSEWLGNVAFSTHRATVVCISWRSLCRPHLRKYGDYYFHIFTDILRSLNHRGECYAIH